MTLCPVALVVHCKGCPIVTVCPAKTVLGDFEEQESSAPGAPADEEDPPADPTG
jgi:hypothetical protein